MTSPLYSVGQHVAVCTPTLLTVIPKTVVVARTWRGAGRRRNPEINKIVMFPASWVYWVQGDDCAITESSLRPINPDTEYLTDSAPQKLEQPCD